MANKCAAKKHRIAQSLAEGESSKILMTTLVPAQIKKFGGKRLSCNFGITAFSQRIKSFKYGACNGLFFYKWSSGD